MTAKQIFKNENKIQACANPVGATRPLGLKPF